LKTILSDQRGRDRSTERQSDNATTTNNKSRENFLSFSSSVSTVLLQRRRAHQIHDEPATVSTVLFTSLPSLEPTFFLNSQRSEKQKDRGQRQREMEIEREMEM